MMEKKSQFAIEFVILLAFMFLIFLAVTAVLTNKILDAKDKEREKIAEDLASLAKKEIEIAKSVTNGYSRKFRMPNTVDGNDYNITILGDNEIVVEYLDKEHVTFLPNNVEGDLQKGINSIRKENGIVYVNS